MVYYFAYGSNMNPERMLNRKAFFTKRMAGKLRGYKLTFSKTSKEHPDEGFGNIIPDSHLVVEGVLYETTEESIKKLDHFEGFPIGYRKETVPIEKSDGEIVDAIVYIANEGQTREDLKPSKWYLEHLLAGKNLLSKEYYRFLESFETRD